MKTALHWVAALFLLLAAGTASATFHTYRIQEIYSNADATIQFVVLKEGDDSDGEDLWKGQRMTVTRSSGNGAQLVFPNNLPSPRTASTYVLVATPAFAALKIITPDYVMPSGFLPTVGGLLDFAGVDLVAFDSLPTDGVNAWYRDGTRAANLARNFAGESASVAVAGPTPPVNCVATINGSSSVALANAGGAVNLAVTGCTPGSGLAYNWTRNGVAGWSTTQNPTEVLPANGSTAAATYSYQVQVCSGTACATFPTAPLTATVPSISTVNISGSVANAAGTPACALILANGAFMFSCSPVGTYSLDVPLDGEGQVTLFGFADGLFPTKYVFSGGGRHDVTLTPAN